MYPDHNFINALSSFILFSLFFVVLVSFIYGFISDKVEPLKFNDHFDLGYITEEEAVVETQPKPVDTTKEQLQQVKLQQEIIKLKKAQLELKQMQEKPVKNKPVKQKAVKPANTLVQDCISALVNMGEHRSSARRIVNKFLAENPQTKTVEQFIVGVFKK